MIGRMALAAALLCATAAAAQPAASPMASEVENFIAAAGPVCQARPASQCIDRFWDKAATNRAKGISLADLRLLRQKFGAWYDFRSAGLLAREKNSIGMGLWLADSLGLERLHAGFDGNGDGYVSKAELLSDVTLDSRPLGETLADPKAVDRSSVSRRFGVPDQLLALLFAASAAR
jgi:hypothetical protein